MIAAPAFNHRCRQSVRHQCAAVLWRCIAQERHTSGGVTGPQRDCSGNGALRGMTRAACMHCDLQLCLNTMRQPRQPR